MHALLRRLTILVSIAAGAWLASVTEAPEEVAWLQPVADAIQSKAEILELTRPTSRVLVGAGVGALIAFLLTMGLFSVRRLVILTLCLAVGGAAGYFADKLGYSTWLEQELFLVGIVPLTTVGLALGALMFAVVDFLRSGRIASPAEPASEVTSTTLPKENQSPGSGTPPQHVPALATATAGPVSTSKQAIETKATDTKDPDKASKDVLRRANALPLRSEQAINLEYNSVRNSWSSKSLIGKQGKDAIPQIIARNLRWQTGRKGFSRFVFETNLDQGQESTQVDAHFRDIRGNPFFIPFRLWRSAEGLWMCGNATCFQSYSEILLAQGNSPVILVIGWPRLPSQDEAIEMIQESIIGDSLEDVQRAGPLSLVTGISASLQYMPSDNPLEAVRSDAVISAEAKHLQGLKVEAVCLRQQPGMWLFGFQKA